MSEASKTSAKIKAQDEIFCHSCGNSIKNEAIVCVHCGVETAYSKNNSALNNTSTVGPVEMKDKTTAVLLAVFLGFWTWLYTYKLDGWKFWLNLVLSVVTFGFWAFVAWIWAIIDVSIKDDTFYKNFPNSR